MEKALIVDIDNCTGCRVCELVCSLYMEGDYNPKKSCITVLSNKETGINIPVLDMSCDFCGRCVEWCPSKALSIIGLDEAIMARKHAKIGKVPVVRMSRTNV